MLLMLCSSVFHASWNCSGRRTLNLRLRIEGIYDKEEEEGGRM